MAAMFVACPHCGHQLVDDGSLAGQHVACPSCNGHFQMPAGHSIPPASFRQRPGFQSSRRKALPSLWLIALLSIGGLCAVGIMVGLLAHNDIAPALSARSLRYSVESCWWDKARDDRTVFLSVSLDVYNGGRDPDGLTNGDIKLKDERGAIYDGSVADQFFSPVGSMNPGTHRYGSLWFHVTRGHNYWLSLPGASIKLNPQERIR